MLLHLVLARYHQDDPASQQIRETGNAPVLARRAILFSRPMSSVRQRNRDRRPMAVLTINLGCCRVLRLSPVVWRCPTQSDEPLPPALQTRRTPKRLPSGGQSTFANSSRLGSDFGIRRAIEKVRRGQPADRERRAIVGTLAGVVRQQTALRGILLMRRRSTRNPQRGDNGSRRTFTGLAYSTPEELERDHSLVRRKSGVARSWCSRFQRIQR